MDIPAILERRPQVCMVDGLAYDNPPGSPNAYRYQDVEQLLVAGVTVITSINIQHIAEMQKAVEEITGKRVREAVPLALIEKADDIVLVDATPEHALQKTGDGASRASVEKQLARLRELALLLAADIVDQQLESYLALHQVQARGVQERLLICLTPRTNAQAMISSAVATAKRLHAEVSAVYVLQPELSQEDQVNLETNLNLARAAGMPVEILESEDPVEEIVRYARMQRVTQIFIGHSVHEGWWSRLFGGTVDRIVRAAKDMDVHIFPH